jgi:hypothetical protein
LNNAAFDMPFVAEVVDKRRSGLIFPSGQDGLRQQFCLILLNEKTMFGNARQTRAVFSG